ncbi:MAG: hypothetical protein WA913_11030 [Pricia sp.]
MKRTNFIIFLACALIPIVSCEDETVVDGVYDNVTRGAVFRTLTIDSPSLNIFDPSSLFSLTAEVESNGVPIDRVDVFLSFNDNSDEAPDNSKEEIAFGSIPASGFSEGPNGFPTITYSSTFMDFITALDLDIDQIAGGDSFDLRFILFLSDGRSFSSGNANSTVLGGSFFRSPFNYGIGINCVPTSPVSGDYVLNITDTYGDGWDGAFFTANIDGDSTNYTIESGGSGSFTITVPEGTTELEFLYTSGNFEAEHVYELIAPTGETAAADGPSPATGAITLNICN